MTSRRHVSRRASILILALASVATAPASRNDAVALSATSAPGYIRPTDERGRPRPESYVFYEGTYLPGNTVDPSLERMTFGDLTKVLAVNLARQEYYPTKDPATADLFIRVFWGATQVYDDPQKAFSIDGLNAALGDYRATYEATETADPGDINAAMEQIGAGQEAAETALMRNAALLGYRRSLDRLGRAPLASPEEVTLRTELSEERYFVVLMAYDQQFMRRTKKPRLLWVTRLSLRGPGNNFTEALPALAQAGAQVYGRSLDGLERIKVRDLPHGEVTLGELKVIGVEETPKEAKVGK